MGRQLGRGVVVSGDKPPAPWAGADTVPIDEATLSTPGPAVLRLHEHWARRRPVVIDLAVDPTRFRAPESITGDVWRHRPDAEPWFDRLHFLVWANNYDARTGELVWWWSAKAARVIDGSRILTPTATSEGAGDLELRDGTIVLIDGGPRTLWDEDGPPVVPAEAVEAGSGAVAPPVRHAADRTDEALAPDQQAAVDHRSGPARVIAPAGSGKTRVLTERLKHLLVDRAYEPSTVLAVAYNKEAQLEMERRVAGRAGHVRPHVRTLNSLGLWVLAQHRGSSPPVIDEREVRRLVESLLPGRRQRRSNTDPIGPYVEALGTVRLGLVDPDVVEQLRDDVDGLAEMFAPYRKQLAERGVVDFDEQIYAAIETLLADGGFRRHIQRSCRHLLVDEFQDLTPAHVLLLRLLSLPGLDVFGVGDDDQCIYGHAGADPAFLIDFTTLFPTAGEHALGVNYRCPAEVVTGATHLLGYNDRRIAKDIVAGPDSDDTVGSLRVVEHGPDRGAVTLVETVQTWLAEPGVVPTGIAVLSRVNALLLAPHVALHDAGVPIRSVLSPDVLTRTGLRAALAYLRIATNPAGFDRRDVVEILRRPTRGLPQWFPERLGRRPTWTVGTVAGMASYVSDKDAVKVERLADDLRLVVDAGRQGTTRHILETVRDDVGLGSAMSLLDRTGGGQGSSHLDDLEGLLGVADLHPDPATFETWLGDAFRREVDADGVTLSTIHRVKGREWDRIAVFGVFDGVLPHRLADDVEEERRVLHVAITRGRHRVTVLTDRTRRSEFLDELAGTAHRRPGRPRSTEPPARPSPGRNSARSQPAVDIELVGAYAAAEQALRDWRRHRSQLDGVPAYVVINDRYLRGIASVMPTSLAELVTCDGIGPAKLERYGEQILEVLGSAAHFATEPE